MGLQDDIAEIKDIVKDSKKKKKKFRLPAKAKVSKARMSKGYSTIMVIHDNKNVEFIKEPITDATYKVKDTFHATDSKDIFFYKGKPLIIQPKRALNPYNPLETKHETYGQKYIMARMEGDKLTLKRKLGWGASIGGLIILAIIAYSVLTGA